MGTYSHAEKDLLNINFSLLFKILPSFCVRENGNHWGVDFDEVTVLSTLKYKVTNHVEQQTFIDKMGGTT